MEVLFGDILERGELVDAGVVDQNVQPAEDRLRLREETPDLRRSRYVCLDGDGPSALACDLGDHTVGAVLAGGIVDDNRGALSRQLLGDGGADLLGRADDNRHGVLALAHVLASLSPRTVAITPIPTRGSVVQARAVTMAWSTALGAAPTTRSTTWPSLTNRIVGIDRMLYRAASLGSASTLTFISVTRPSEASASSSR